MRKFFFIVFACGILLSLMLVFTPQPAFAATDCSTQTEIPQAECEALIALYNSANGVTWSTKTGWNVTQMPCSWTGVTCASGHVIRLNLGFNLMTGTIAPEIGNLIYLEELIFEKNLLSGSIPPELGNLTNLTLLRLNLNSLSGSIPPELGNLTNLTQLRLYSNQLSGSIPPEMGNLSHLSELGLSGNQLTGSIPPELGNLSQLLGLSLNFNQLSGSIPPMLGNLTNLQSLYLHHNSLTGDIPTSLGNLTNLQILWLNDNLLSGSIPSELGNLPNLKQLNLGINTLGGSIPASLGDLTNLQLLYASENQLSGSIPPELGNLPNLKQLNLGINRLSGSIPASLGDLQLTLLHLQGNQLSGDIPANLMNLDTLILLGINHNMVTASDLALITFLDDNQRGWADTQTIPPTGLTGDPTKTTIYLSWEPIPYTQDGGYYEISYSTTPNGTYIIAGNTTDKTINSFEITGLTAETSYYIAVRTFTPVHSNNQNALTSAWSNEITVTTLDPICDSQTVIPKSECQALRGVYTTLGVNPTWMLDSNPCSWGGVTCSDEVNYPPDNHVIGINLYSSSLSGSIAPEIGNLSHLTELDLFYNSITGSIPSEIGNLAQLTKLALNYNYLSGDIPAEIGDLTQLTELNLGDNQLSGEIPATLGNLTNLLFFSVGENDLNGEIPSELGNLTLLENLSLVDNKLSGSIPAEIGNLTNLTTLRLNYNQLGGSIPSSFTNLTNLNTLRLQYNMLVASGSDLLTFLSSKEPGWDQTQTVPPSNITAGAVTQTTIPLSWTTIPYTQDTGYYEIGYRTSLNEAYTIEGQTADKTINSFTITNLQKETSYRIALRTFTSNHIPLTSAWSEEIEITTSGEAPTDEPTPTETAAPTDEPTPTESPSPTNEVTPTDEPTPTTEVTPTSEVTPTDEPTPTDDLNPTDEATPTSEVTPTDEPTTTNIPLEGLDRIAPADGAVIDQNSEYPPQFQWFPVNGAEWYHVYVADAGYTTAYWDKWYKASDVCSGNICTTLDDIWVFGKGDYVWWMTYWSPSVANYIELYNMSEFTLDFPLPGTLNNSAPAGEISSGSNVDVTWQNNPNVLWYQIWVGPNTYASINYFNWKEAADICTQDICTLDVPGTLSSGGYEVWVQPWNPTGFNTPIDGWQLLTEFTVP